MSEINYKEVVDDLKKKVKVIDGNIVERTKIKEKMNPDCVVFRKDSKRYKKELKKLEIYIDNKDKALKEKINTDGKEDYEKLLEMNLELSKLELKKDKDINKFKKIKKEHYKKIQPFITNNRNLSKEIKKITEEVLENIRK